MKVAEETIRLEEGLVGECADQFFSIVSQGGVADR